MILQMALSGRWFCLKTYNSLDFALLQTQKWSNKVSVVVVNKGLNSLSKNIELFKSPPVVPD